MSIVSGSPPAAPASMGGLSSAVEDLSVLPEMNSLRFDGDSYATRVESRTGSQNKMTASFWMKISKIDRTNFLFGHSNTAGSDTHSFFMQLTDSNQLQISCAGTALKSHAILRDPSAWYHVVVSLDSTNITSTERIQIFLNGTELALDESFTGGGYPSDTSNLSIAGYRFIMSDPWGQSSRHFNGHMANIQFIDGQALDADSFGEWISDIWRPRPYTGDYGVNGFHLDFAGENMVYDSNGKLTQVLDASSNDNHWTAH